MEPRQGEEIDKINKAKPTQHPVFDVDEVEARWAQMQIAGPSSEHSALLGIYERLLHRGALRTWAKPQGMPDMAALYADLPNFAPPLDEVKRQLALSQDSDEAKPILRASWRSWWAPVPSWST
jgi:hypothetical protein